MLQSNRRESSFRRWPIFVVGLLSLHVVGMLWAVAITARSPGESAVIPDYYGKAQAWDSYKQQLAANQQLGWKLYLQPSDQLDSIGRRQATVMIVDANNRPLSGATLAVHCFHLSHGDLAADVNPLDQGGGKYLLSLPLDRAGFWEFDMTVNAAGKTFIQTLTRYVP